MSKTHGNFCAYLALGCGVTVHRLLDRITGGEGVLFVESAAVLRVGFVKRHPSLADDQLQFRELPF